MTLDSGCWEFHSRHGVADEWTSYGESSFTDINLAIETCESLGPTDCAAVHIRDVPEVTTRTRNTPIRPEIHLKRSTTLIPSPTVIDQRTGEAYPDNFSGRTNNGAHLEGTWLRKASCNQ